MIMPRFALLSSFAALLPLMACAASSAPAQSVDETDAELRATQGCEGKKLGDTCHLCPTTDPSCIETAEVKTCQADPGGSTKLRCIGGTKVPPPPAGYVPCAGKKVGAQCTICDPTDASCIETAVVKTCDAKGACVSGTSAPPPYSACAGKKTGAQCTICDPADASCIETALYKTCNARGECVAGR